MTYTIGILVFYLLSLTHAVPWPPNIPLCSQECPITGSPKLAYEAGKTYLYSYQGKSVVHLEDVEGGDTTSSWRTEVYLTWLSPCDVAITIDNPLIDGAAGPPEASTIGRYPLVAAVTDGQVQYVCSHPDDDTWAINIKKGIATAFQNSLPSLSPVNSGIIFTETDVVGSCPTKYIVEPGKNKTIVTKEKQHQLCKNHYQTRSEIPIAWLKAPLPIEQSKSSCQQEITGKIYSKVICKNNNIIRPTYGSYKYIVANQEVTLTLQSRNVDTPSSINNLQGHFIRKNLLYDYQTPKKDPSVVAKVHHILKQICIRSKETNIQDLAQLIGETIDYLKQVPNGTIEDILHKIRSKQFCIEFAKLETLFLDALAFVYESDAIKVISEELMNPKISESRKALYNIALYLTPRPDVKAVNALKNIFIESRNLPQSSLAAASVVNTYCRLNENCDSQPPVIQILQIIGDNIQLQCANTDSDEAQKVALAYLKTLGNLGVMNIHYARAIIRCMESEDADINVRIAAAQSFRNTKCLREASIQLAAIAVDSNVNSEVRIASYLAAIRCTEEEDLIMMIEKITKEKNTQVRGFILSHLLNVQRSTFPKHYHLREMLTDYLLPSNFSVDFRKYSSNIDLSYYLANLGSGGQLESNIVFPTASYIPRYIDFNLTTLIRGSTLNLGEFGARVKGIEQTLAYLFGPEGYFRISSYTKMMNDMNLFSKKKGQKIVEELENIIRYRRSIDTSTILSFLEKLYGSVKANDPEINIFVRLMGQELFYSTLKGNVDDIDADKLIAEAFSLIQEWIYEMKNLSIDMSRAAHLKIDYSIPTIHGVPLKLELEGTAVVDIKVNGKVDIIQFLLDARDTEGLLRINPSLSARINGFVGYDSYIVRNGLKFKNTFNNNEGVYLTIKVSPEKEFEIGLDIPQKTDLINIESEAYLMKSILTRPEEKIMPSSVRDIRFKNHTCNDYLETILGIEICYDVNVPNIFLSKGLPLGEKSKINLTLRKKDPAMTGYKLKTHVQDVDGQKVARLEIKVCGSSEASEAEAVLAYHKNPNSHEISATFQRAGESRGIMMKLSKEILEKELEVFVSYKTAHHNMIHRLKIDMTTLRYNSSEAIDIKIYTSPNLKITESSLVADWKFVKTSSGNKVTYDMQVKTNNALRNLVGINFDCITDLSFQPYRVIPFTIAMQKFEVQLSVRDWNVTSFIRKNTISSYRTSFEITQRHANVISVIANHALTGHLEQYFTIKTDLTAKLGDQIFNVSFAIINELIEIGFTTEVITPATKEKILKTELLIGSVDNTAYSKLLIDIPHHMKPVQFNTKITNQGYDKVIVHSFLNHDGHLMFEVSGSLVISLAMPVFTLDADIRLLILTTGPYNLKTILQVSEIRQLMSIDLKDTGKRVVFFKWDVNAEEKIKTIYGIGLHIPTVIESKVDLLFTEAEVNMIMDNIFFSQTPYPRRLKGFAVLNVINKTLDANIAWDADRFPNKKLGLHLALNPIEADATHLSILGDITFMSKVYNMRLTCDADGDITSVLVTRGFELIVETPSNKIAKLQTLLKIVHHNSFIEIEAHYLWNNLQQKICRSDVMLSIVNLHSPYSYKIVTKMKHVSANNHVSQLTTEVKHWLSSAERMITFKVEATNRVVKTPLKIELSMQNTEHSIKLDLDTDIDKRMSITSWDLQSYPEGGVKYVNVVIELIAAMYCLQTLKKMADVGVDLDAISMVEYEQTGPPLIYNYVYESPSPNTHAVVFRVPSRTIEGNLTLSSSEYRLLLNPHKEKGDSIYEFVSMFRKSEDATYSEWLNQVNHPSLGGHLKMNAQYQNTGRHVNGTIMIDTFPDVADKITGSIQSTQISENSHLIEASITTRILKDHPKLTVVAAKAANEIGLDIEFRTRPTAGPSFVLSSKYGQTTGHHSAFSLILNSEGQMALDISGTAKPLALLSCDASKIVLHSNIPVIGKYDMQADICHANFVQLTTRINGNSTGSYKATLGLRQPNEFEVSFSEYQGIFSKQPMMLLKCQLETPTLVTSAVSYRSQEWNKVVNLARAKMMKIGKAVDGWFNRICGYLKQEAKKQKINFPPAKLVILFGTMKRDIAGIYKDLVQNGIILKYKQFVHLLQSKTITQIESNLKWVWSHIPLYQNMLQNHLYQEASAWETEFKGIVDVVIEGVAEATNFIETGKTPKAIEEVWKKLEESFVIQKIEKLLESFSKNHPEEFRGLQQVVTKAKATLSQDEIQMRKQLLADPHIQGLLLWITHNTGHWTLLEARRIASWTIQKLTFFSIVTENDGIKMSVPLRKPVYSLVQVLQRVSFSDLSKNMVLSYYSFIPAPLDNLLWTYYNFLPNKVADLLPPYNRTAMVVSDTQLLTFDGDLLRLPRSKCQVLLAAYLLNNLIMEYPEENEAPQFTLEVSNSMVIVVRPDSRVTVNGHLITEPHYKEGPISITNTHLQVRVVAPFFILRIAQTSRMVSLEVSGWAFGRVAGLLGTYDGEIGNDRVMPNGAKATSLQQLVSAWQENPLCETPSIGPVNPQFSKVIRCNAILNIRSRCNALVDPNPFIQMCYAGRDTCDVVKAYRTLCSEKGVIPLVPMGC